MTDTNNVTETVKGKRGRKSFIPDSLFVDMVKSASSIDDVINSFVVFGKTLEGEEKNKFNAWLENKSEKALRLYISMRASNLRRKGAIITNARNDAEKNTFKPGPKNTSQESIQSETSEESQVLVAE